MQLNNIWIPIELKSEKDTAINKMESLLIAIVRIVGKFRLGQLMIFQCQQFTETFMEELTNLHAFLRNLLRFGYDSNEEVYRPPRAWEY